MQHMATVLSRWEKQGTGSRKGILGAHGASSMEVDRKGKLEANHPRVPTRGGGTMSNKLHVGMGKAARMNSHGLGCPAC